MGSPLDTAAVALLSLGALGFVVWRFALAKSKPACAPEETARPQVLIGARLAKGLAAAKKEGTPTSGEAKPGAAMVGTPRNSR